jgi:hypothetical protein
VFPRILSVILLAIAVATSMSDANASFPPKSFKASREDMARACAALGSNVSYDAWNYKPGEYGCVDLRTGNVVICKDDGTCKLYFGARPRKGGIGMAA